MLHRRNIRITFFLNPKSLGGRGKRHCFKRRATRLLVQKYSTQYAVDLQRRTLNSRLSVRYFEACPEMVYAMMGLS